MTDGQMYHWRNSGVKIPNRIFVGGIPYDCTTDELTQFFCHYGFVAQSKIIKDSLGISKGYGFITFGRNSDAHNVLRMGTVFFREKKLKIAPAVRKLDNWPTEILRDENTISHGMNPTFPNGLCLPPSQTLYLFHPGQATHAPDVNSQYHHSLFPFAHQPQSQNYDKDALVMSYGTDNPGAVTGVVGLMFRKHPSPADKQLAHAVHLIRLC